MCVQHALASSLRCQLLRCQAEVVVKIGQDVSEIHKNTGSQNRAVRDTCNFYRFSTYADRYLDSEQVRNLDYREIQV